MAIAKKKTGVKAKTASVKKPVAKTPAKAAPKKAVAKPAAKKPVAKKAVTKKVATKKPVAKPVAAKAAPKAVAKKTAVKKPVAKKPAAKKADVKPMGLSEQMLEAALKVLDERKAEDIVAISLTGRSSLADYLIIASGRAGRQVVAIADYLREAFFKLGVRKVHVEGREEANWVLVDAGDVVIHLFRPEVREYYDLDSIWNGKTPQK